MQLSSPQASSARTRLSKSSSPGTASVSGLSRPCFGKTCRRWRDTSSSSGRSQSLPTWFSTWSRHCSTLESDSMSVTTAKQSLPRARRLVPREHISSRVKVGFGLGFLGLLMLAALFFPLPHSPTATDPNALLQSPSRDHWFGTNSVGTDVFSRTIKAAETDLPLALAGTLAALMIGVPLGIWIASSP